MLPSNKFKVMSAPIELNSTPFEQKLAHTRGSIRILYLHPIYLYKLWAMYTRGSIRIFYLHPIYLYKLWAMYTTGSIRIFYLHPRYFKLWAIYESSIRTKRSSIRTKWLIPDDYTPDNHWNLTLSGQKLAHTRGGMEIFFIWCFEWFRFGLGLV